LPEGGRPQPVAYGLKAADPLALAQAPPAGLDGHDQCLCWMQWLAGGPVPP